MKHTTNFFIFLILFICMTQNASAIVYTGLFDEPNGIAYYSSGEFIITQTGATDNIKIFNPDGAGSTSTLVSNISSPVEAVCLAADGELFFVLQNGEVYRKYDSLYLKDFTSQFDGNFQQIGDMDALNMDRDIVVDYNKNIYSTSGDDVIIFTYPSYASSIYVSVSDQHSPSTNNVASLAVHPDGLLIGARARLHGGYNTISTRLYLYDGSSLSSLWSQTKTGTGPFEFEIDNIFSTKQSDIYIAYSETNTLYRLNSSDTYSESTISNLAYTPSGLCLDTDGVLYVLSQTDDNIVTYSTVDAQGGYFYIGTTGAGGMIQLDYDVAIINSLYTAYNNDSTIEIAYSIDIDLVQGITTQDFYGSDGYPQYYYVVDILDPNGIKQKTSIINTFEKDYNLVSGWHVLSVGTLQYSSTVWGNGTWSAILYEFDMNTGLRASLDSCEYEIYDQVSDTIVSDVTPEIDPTLNPIDRIDALLQSGAFIGLLIILACIGAFGKIGGVVGVVLGTVAGISLSYLLGYIPAWILFIMILTLCVVFASKIVGQIGGGNE